jgi:DNA-binding CsgD family transcriptional regulator
MKNKSKAKKKLIVYLNLLIGILVLSSCSNDKKIEIDYSFEAAINVKQNVSNYSQIDFKPFDNLDLGFFKGNVWIKLEVTNKDKQASYIVITNDLINRNYKFFKLDTLDDKMKLAALVEDFTKHDYRTFNYPKPNFKIDLAPNQSATFIISTESDGRILQATPKLLKADDYQEIINATTIVNIVFFILMGIIILINLLHWSFLKKKIYYYYGFYIISSCLFYLNVEGYLYGLGFKHYTIDHFMFLSIRLWIFSLVLFSAKFLELNITNPKFYKYIKWTLLIVLGTTTLYQFLFYDSSISNLHLLENLFGFLWVLLAITMIRLSFKKRRLESIYYLITFSFLVIFITLGLIDSHTTILPGDPFSYFKIGTVLEFIGFTYFISLIIKKNIKKGDVLENKLLKNQQELMLVSEQLKSKSIEKTDLLNIFKLLESSLSKEEGWLEFKSKFEKLDPLFLVILKQKHSDLSKSEIRLLTLIRIGFTQKEIANILNIAPDSVKKSRQRVRKKMNISQSNELRNYLLNLNQ